MLKTFAGVLCLLIVVAHVNAQTPGAPVNYRELVTSSILRDYPGMLHEPTGALAFPFITPGSVYANQLWDWDSWLSDVALCQIIVDQGEKVDKQKMLSYGRGCVLNFLSAATPDGEIPIQIVVNSRSKRAPLRSPIPHRTCTSRCWRSTLHSS